MTNEQANMIARAIETYVDERLALLTYGADKTAEECQHAAMAARADLVRSLTAAESWVPIDETA